MKTKEDIWFEIWHKSNDASPTKETIIKAMDKFAKEYHKEQLSISGAMGRLPESDEIKQKAQEMDEKEFEQWWWENVYKN